MNGAPESQTAASASPLVGPYPIDEDAAEIEALARRRRVDAHEFKRRKAEALLWGPGPGLPEGGHPAPTPRQTSGAPGAVQFTDPNRCAIERTSKTLHIDLQGTKAWARLAEAQYPPPTPRDDDEARSHVLRREIAKAPPYPRRVRKGFLARFEAVRLSDGLTLQEVISRETPALVEFTRNSFSDFTYFVRLEDRGRLVWEGDLRGESGGDGLLRLPMHHLNLDWDPESWPDGCRSERARSKTTGCGRDADQACLFGQFSFFCASGQVEGQYDFSLTRCCFRPHGLDCLRTRISISRDAHVRDSSSGPPFCWADAPSPDALSSSLSTLRHR